MTADLDTEQWNRQLLQRDTKRTVEETVRDSAGIYSTAPTSYLSLVARIPGFHRSDLDRALYQDRTLVRVSALRGSAFLIPIDMVDTVLAASDRGNVFAQWAEKIVGADRVEAWRAQVMRLLDGRVLPAREIRKEFGVSGREAEALRYVLSSLTLSQELAAASGPRSWRDNQYGYALWSQWFPEHRPRAIDAQQARVALAEWYLRGHGPAEAGDLAWFAGMKKTNALAALRESAAIETDDGWFDLPGLSSDAKPHGWRLLPVWDTALVRQKGWRRMVPEELYRFVYDTGGNVTSTIARDGEVVGVWDRGGDNERLEIKAAFLRPVGRTGEKAVETEAELMARALGVQDVSVAFLPAAVDLHADSRNRFMSPLSGS